MVAGLYFFDHSVASQLAQQKEFNLKKPSAYHYDILVLGFMVRGIFLSYSVSIYSGPSVVSFIPGFLRQVTPVNPKYDIYFLLLP